MTATPLRTSDRVLGWRRDEPETLASSERWVAVRSWLASVAEASANEGWALALPGERRLEADDWRELAAAADLPAFERALMLKLGFDEASLTRHGLGADACVDFIAALDDALLASEGARAGGVLALDEHAWRRIAREPLPYGDDGAEVRTRILTRGQRQNLPTLGALRLPSGGAVRAPTSPREEAVQRVARDPAAYATLPPALREDRYVALALIERSPSAFRELSPTLRNDPAIAREAVRVYPGAFAAAGPAARADPEIALLAIERNAGLYAHADLSALRDPALAQAIVRCQPWAVFILPEPLRNDPQIQQASGLPPAQLAPLVRLRECGASMSDADRAWLREVLPTCGVLHRALPEAWRRDPELARLAVGHASSVFVSLSPELRANESVALAAVARNARLAWPLIPAELRASDAMRAAVLRSAHVETWPALSSLPEGWRTDPDFVVAFLSRSSQNQDYGDLPESLSSDAAFMRRLLAVAPRSYLSFPAERVRDLDLWADLAGEPAVRRWMPIARELAELRARDPAAFARLEERFIAAEITCLDRFPSVASLERVLADRTPQPDDMRPVALIYLSPADHNSAFAYSTQLMLPFLTAHYRVVYREVESDREVLEHALRDGAGLRPRFGMIGGHGIPSTVGLARGTGDGANLDIADSEALRSAAEIFDHDAVLVLESCSSGAGGELDANTANAVTSAWPGTLFSLAAPGSVAGFNLDADGLISGMRFNVPAYVSRDGGGRVLGLDRAGLVAQIDARYVRFISNAWTEDDLRWLEDMTASGAVDDLTGSQRQAWNSLLDAALQSAERRHDWPLVWRVLSWLLANLPYLVWQWSGGDENPEADRARALVERAKRAYISLYEAGHT